MSKMIDDLVRQDIKLKSYNVGSHKTICPRCSHTRSDKKDPCLWINIKSPELALGKCHNCSWRPKAGDVTSGARAEQQEERREYKKPDIKPENTVLPAHVQEYLLSRGLTRPAWERARLYWDAKAEALCFPYYVDGQVINVKYRTMDKRFRMVKGAQLIFYGLDDIAGKDEVIIVEGEFDKLALEVAGITNVISVPNGAPADISKGEDIDNSKAFAYFGHAEQLLAKAKRILIAVDNDQAGRNLEHELLRRLGVDRCARVTFPTKDANDCLMKFGIDEMLAAVNAALPYPIKGLYRVDQFEQELSDYFNTGMVPGVNTGWENLDKIYTVKLAELTVVTGVPNSGKSEWMDALMINLATNENWSFAIFSPEHKKEQHVGRLIEKVVGQPAGSTSKNRMSHEAFMDGAAWVGKRFHFMVSDDDEQLPTLDWILDRARAAVYRYGVKGVIIDPWNEIEHQRPKGMEETDYVGRCLARVNRWKRKHGVHVWIVAHPAKPQKDKDGKYRVPVLYDISGSANWFNKCDNGIVVHISDGAASATEIHVQKVRDKHTGKRGTINLAFDRPTGRYRVPENKTSKVYEPEDSEQFDF